MTRTSTIVGFIVAAALLAVASMLFATASPSRAADPVCEYTYDAVKLQFEDAGSPVVEIEQERIPELVADVERNTGQNLGDVTRAFIGTAHGQLLLGLEQDGCLLPPIFVGYAPTGRSA